VKKIFKKDPYLMPGEVWEKALTVAKKWSY